MWVCGVYAQLTFLECLELGPVTRFSSCFLGSDKLVADDGIFLCKLPNFPSIECSHFRVHDLIQFVQIDITQEWAQHAPYNVANFENLFLRGAVVLEEEDSPGTPHEPAPDRSQRA